MPKISGRSTLFVGIDVSEDINRVHAVDFQGGSRISSTFSDGQAGANELAGMLSAYMRDCPWFTAITAVLEATNIYSIHLADVLSANESLIPYRIRVYCVKPERVEKKPAFGEEIAYRPRSALMLATLARVGYTKDSAPWRGAQFYALKRLTRQRVLLTEALAREKAGMISRLYLALGEDVKTGTMGTASDRITPSAFVLTEFLTWQEIIDLSEEELLTFLAQKCNSSISDLSKASRLIRKAKRESRRPGLSGYEPLGSALASSYLHISTCQEELKLLDEAIEKCGSGIDEDALAVLQSIPGMRPLWALGILSEIGIITCFSSPKMISVYSGLSWSRKGSDDSSPDKGRPSKYGNASLRYYLTEAANNARKELPEYRAYYEKKASEEAAHPHKRALSLTSRKFVQLIFALLQENQCYSAETAAAGHKGSQPE